MIVRTSLAHGAGVTSLELPYPTRTRRRVRRAALRRGGLSQAWGDAPGRRVLNVTIAALGLIVAAPVMLVISVLVRATSRGPILFAQPRVGLDRRDPVNGRPNSRRRFDMGGKPFTIYKFRTMRVQDDREAEVWAQPDDPRVTPVGRVLRKYRLDELPQLWNVLSGDMNVVGPRPEQPRIFQELRSRIDNYPVRQRVRPGITGWAQINQHYDTSFEDVERKVTLDLEYISRQSLSEDVKIMLKTVPVMVLRKGAW